MRRLTVFFSCILLVCCTAFANAEDELRAAWDEARGVLVSEYEETIKKLIAAYTARAEPLEQEAINDIMKEAVRAVRNNNTASAKDIWLQVLRMDPNNEAAHEFFEAIGILEEMEAQLEAEQQALASAEKDFLGNTIDVS